MTEENIKKIGLDKMTFQDISLNDKFLINDEDGKEKKIFIMFKDRNNFYGAYRTKNNSGANEISITTYHVYPNNLTEDFGTNTHYVEGDEITGEFYQKCDSRMKSFGM